MLVNDKIKALRDLMKKNGFTCYMEPTGDPHSSEYVADYYKGREFLTDFTGSAGTAIVTLDKAILWTDGRYFIQAENQIKDSEFILYKMSTPGYPSVSEWLEKNLKEGDNLAINQLLVSQKTIENLSDSLIKKGVVVKPTEDLLDSIWIDRPSLPTNPIFKLDMQYTGKSVEDKLEELRENLQNEEADYFLLSSLDDIAWLFNIRGGDVTYTPVVISYALISANSANLYIDKNKVSNTIEEDLKKHGVSVSDYEDIKIDVENIALGSKILLNKARTNAWIYSSIKDGIEVIDKTDITEHLKGKKNETELANLRKAYIKDGIALSKFFYWLEHEIGNQDINELSAAQKLLEFREEQEGFIEPSFGTISAYGPNGAMMHYSATKESFSKLEQEGLYLVDSGGQYYNGTTDITRTISLGKPTSEEKRDFTLALKGHVNLISAKFLEGASGHALDVLARYPLWQEGIDYKSGTGHGVGYLLGVHEGPHRISTMPNQVALEEGMVVTIEPGVYKQGKYGIRHENVVNVIKNIKNESGQFMNFAVLSYCYFDLACIDKELLTKHEIDWINDYHNEVYTKIAQYLTESEAVWLKEKTRKI
ncbi:MAG: aminopeptidase P family protein [Gudongella sp.]|nr:aminopeptidase P family protein [Gudongella sp.]